MELNIMDEMITILKSIDQRLASIERLLVKPDLSDVLVKGEYSTQESADLSMLYGTKSAAPFTVRHACNDGRIPEATKNGSGQYRIPREAVLRILEEGILPERR